MSDPAPNSNTHSNTPSNPPPQPEPQKTFTVLENNPEVMNHLAYSLGLAPTLAFYDVYSLTDPSLLSLIPRPVHALLVIIPMTPSWHRSREAEDAGKPEEYESSEEDPVVWFKQTIRHACGSIGLLHCLLNAPAAQTQITPGSPLSSILTTSKRLSTASTRAAVLSTSTALAEAHEAAAQLGDTRAPSAEDGDRLGQHFVAFVKGPDGHLWELEGSRRGPLDRGVLRDEEDALSGRALELGLGRLMEMERREGSGDLRFSCIALAPVLE